LIPGATEKATRAGTKGDPMNEHLDSKEDNKDKNHLPALSVLTTLFFMWGFLTCLNDILIPHLKAVFSLNYFQAMLIQFVFFAAFFIISLPSGYLVKKIGYKKGIVVGLVTSGIGCLLFYPAAGYRFYALFLLAFFIMASGIALLQVAANPYVTILGKSKTASSRLTLTQAFNSLGTTVAPFFGSLLILSVAVKSASELETLSSADLNIYQLAEAAAVQVPYLVLAAALFLLAGIMAFLKLPVIKKEDENSEANNFHDFEHLHQSAWGYRHLVLGAIGIFVYVGGEVAIGSFLVNFLGEKDIAGLSKYSAGQYVSFYWGGAMVGRFIGSALMTKINPGKLLSCNAAIAALLVVMTMLFDGSVAMWSILSIGLFNSIMFPTIFSLALNGLGKHTSKGSGILCMAIVGGAIIPLLQGALADRIGIHHAFILPVLCYAYIVYFGIKGSIPEFVKTAEA
jgi:FHS family L-fucose permease-like MFS transporter